MKFVNIFLITLMAGLLAADIAKQPANEYMAAKQDSGIACHCPTHEEEVQSRKTYIIDCSSDETTAQKFHNQSKIIISSQILAPNNAGNISLYPSKSYHLSDWDSPVETPPPRHINS